MELLELEEKPPVPLSASPDDAFDRRMTRMTTATISSSSYFDSGDGRRYQELEEEMKASGPPPPAPLSIDEGDHGPVQPRVHSVQSASNVLALASRARGNDALSPSVPMRRYNSSQSMMQAAMERKRSAGSVLRAKGEDRTGFARIYFENKNFTSSTVFRLWSTTTVFEVREAMATKINIPKQDFNNYAIVVVFPTDNAGSLSARTLRDEELILPLVERLNRARPVQAVEADDTIGGTTRTKVKHRQRPPVKFVLKDVQGSHLDISETAEKPRRQASDTQSINFPVLLGKGVYSGYLQKASSRDRSLWRKRWFIIKGDQLLYCKSNVNQQDVTSISLLGAVLAKAKPEAGVPYAFQLKTPRRDYELSASTKDEMVAWIHALHVQIGLCSENHRLYEAEIWITEDAVNRTQDEWKHLKTIVHAIQFLNIVHADELNQLRQSYQAEQSKRRLSMAMNNDGYEEYPRTDVIVPVQMKLFKAIEAGPFEEFLLKNGYRLLLERIIGAIA
ncbi:rho gtpase activating protein 2 [Phytophthora cinnamomi]|uniref:rho gtpase activating protein 2 n=1 Tax=Phytophthora cinnamomi TaxID=4785 RepID=UPI00355A03DC|nr:rho gtpase activating protein 2 [Phytophthora cinnamomi]